MTEIHGFADEGFGPVADAFKENFTLDTETGAACAIYHRGRLVVDLHGGLADNTTGQPWNADTVAVAFSATKSVSSGSSDCFGAELDEVMGTGGRRKG